MVSAWPEGNVAKAVPNRGDPRRVKHIEGEYPAPTLIARPEGDVVRYGNRSGTYEKIYPLE